MFKGITLAGAVLFSGLAFAGATKVTSCPSLSEFTAVQSAYQEVHPIIPGKLYSTFKIIELQKDSSWAVFVGPISASNIDSVFDLTDYILARASVNGELVNTEGGLVCMYDSGMPGLYIAAVGGGELGDQQKMMDQFVKKQSQ